MTVEVLATPRKPLTARQLLTLWEAAKGICCICGSKIDASKKWVETLKGAKGFVDEHKRPLGLGGTNKLANRGPAHIECAKVKTSDDIAQINKAKDQKARHIGATRPKQSIKSAPFPHSERTHEGRQVASGATGIARRYGLVAKHNSGCC